MLIKTLFLFCFYTSHSLPLLTHFSSVENDASLVYTPTSHSCPSIAGQHSKFFLGHIFACSHSPQLSSKWYSLVQNPSQPTATLTAAGQQCIFPSSFILAWTYSPKFISKWCFFIPNSTHSPQLLPPLLFHTPFIFSSNHTLAWVHISQFSSK